MLLNTQIWSATVEAAKAKSADNAYILRAIDRAVREINRSKYWSFADGVLKIQSTTSKKLYVIDAEHKCEATANGFRYCKHITCALLMKRYQERLAA